MLLRPTLRLALAAVLLVAPGKALRPPSTAHAGGRPAAGLGRRQAVLSGAAAALLSGGAAPAFAEKKKDYMTMSEYQELKQKEKKDEDTFGKFEALSTRASQTAEFDSLAAKGDFGKVTELARAWDATVRKEVLEKASETLKGARAPAPHAASPCRVAVPRRLAAASERAALPQATTRPRARG